MMDLIPHSGVGKLVRSSGSLGILFEILQEIRGASDLLQRRGRDDKLLVWPP